MVETDAPVSIKSPTCPDLSHSSIPKYNFSSHTSVSFTRKCAPDTHKLPQTNKQTYLSRADYNYPGYEESSGMTIANACQCQISDGWM